MESPRIHEFRKDLDAGHFISRFFVDVMASMLRDIINAENTSLQSCAYVFYKPKKSMALQ